MTGLSHPSTYTEKKRQHKRLDMSLTPINSMQKKLTTQNTR